MTIASDAAKAAVYAQAHIKKFPESPTSIHFFTLIETIRATSQIGVLFQKYMAHVEKTTGHTQVPRVIGQQAFSEGEMNVLKETERLMKIDSKNKSSTWCKTVF